MFRFLKVMHRCMVAVIRFVQALLTARPAAVCFLKAMLHGLVSFDAYSLTRSVHCLRKPGADG